MSAEHKHFTGVPGNNAKGRVTDRSNDHDAPSEAARGKLYERILVSTRATGTKYVASQNHEWSRDEIDAVYKLPDRAIGAEPKDALTLVDFVVQPDFQAAKHPGFPLESERVALAPVEIRFESSHTCKETRLTESRLEIQEVAGREGERVHFHAVLKRKA